jgi:aminoglycoside phosphotransferase (APT) family kinase protein
MSERDLIDASRPIRAGEEIELQRLTAFLAESVPELADSGSIELRQFPSGHSNLTYLLRANGKEYVLRRPPFGSKVKSAHDMSREYRILSRLHPVYPLAPEPLVFCDDAAVIGADFYLMRRLRGVIVRKDFPPELQMTVEAVRKVQSKLIDNLAALHAIDYEAAGLGDLGKPAGYVERQVKGWTRRYGDSHTDQIEVVERVAKWLAEHLPAESGAALIHNDYKLDNVVLDPVAPTEIIGVLDWEMSTLGDPLMDLGTTLGYWIEEADLPPMHAMRMAPTTVPGSLTRREIVERYSERSGRDVPDVLFYYVFGLFKLAVVLQQIYYRYKKGLTSDERFAAFIMGVEGLCHQAAHSVELGRV